MASKSLGTLTLDLVAKVGGFVGGLDKAERESEKFRRQVARQMKDVTQTLVGLGLAGGAAVAYLTKTSISNAAALYDMSQAYGVAVEDLSAYTHGADLAGVSQQELAAGLSRLARAVESDEDVFKKLGISTRDSRGELRSMTDVLGDVADVFAGLEDGTAKTALAQDLLGRSGARLIPILNEGKAGLAAMRAEAEEFGLVISAETAAAADQFEDNLTLLKGVVRGTGNEIAAGLLPSLIDFTEILLDPENRRAIADIIKGIADITVTVAELTVGLITASTELSRFFGESLAAKLGGAAFGDLPRLEDQLAEINRQIDRLEDPRRGSLNVNEEGRLAQLQEEREQTEELIRLTREFAESRAARTPAASGGAPPSGAGSPLLSDEEISQQEALKKLYDDRLAQYQQQIALGANASELRRVQYEMEHGALQGLTQAQREQLELLAQTVSTQRLEEVIEGQREAGEQIEGDLRKQIALMGETTEAARLRYELDQEAYAYMDPLQKARIIALAEELDAQRALAEEDKERQKEIEASAKSLQEFGLEAARNMQGHFADFLFDPFEDGLKGMVKGMGQTVRRMAAEIASSAILKSLFGFLGKSSNPYLAAFGGAFAGKFDGGGTIGAGQWGIVGEIGPEIVRGPAMVTSREQTAGMLGGGVNVNIINNAGANVRQGATRFDGGRRTIDIIVDAVKEGGRNGQLDDLFGEFGMSRARGSN